MNHLRKMLFSAGDAGASASVSSGESGIDEIPEDIEKLKGALVKERKLRKDAEKEASAARRTSSMSIDERVQQLEARNYELELNDRKSQAIAQAIAGVGKGYVVDREAVDELLSVAHITADNVEDVVSVIVKRNTRPDIILPEHQNTQGRSDRAEPRPYSPPTLESAFGGN